MKTSLAKPSDCKHQSACGKDEHITPGEWEGGGGGMGQGQDHEDMESIRIRARTQDQDKKGIAAE